MGNRTVGLGDEQFALMGEALKVGQTAPDVVLRDAEGMFTLNRFAVLGDAQGKTRLISVVPSITTTVCDAQTRRMDEIATEIAAEMGTEVGDHVAVLTVSADLPMAQKAWCGSAGVARVKMVSDHADLAFGAAWGTGIMDMRLNQRALFVVDVEDVVRYAEYVPTMGEHPNYDAALQALRATVSATA